MTERELSESTSDDLEEFKDDTEKSKIGEVGLLTSYLGASLNNRNITGGTNDKASGILKENIAKTKEIITNRNITNPNNPPDSLDPSYLGIAVGVLVIVILILIVAIVFILYKNYQY